MSATGSTIIERSAGLIVLTARDWYQRMWAANGSLPFDLEDAIQHARLTLLERADRYDPARGAESTWVVLETKWALQKYFRQLYGRATLDGPTQRRRAHGMRALDIDDPTLRERLSVEPDEDRAFLDDLEFHLEREHPDLAPLLRLSRAGWRQHQIATEFGVSQIAISRKLARVAQIGKELAAV